MQLPIGKRGAIGLLLIGAVGDLLTTIVGIELFGLVESNGVPAALMSQFGYAGLLPLTLLMFGVTLVGARIIEGIGGEHGRAGAVVAIALVGGIKIIVTAWNAVLIGVSL